MTGIVLTPFNSKCLFLTLSYTWIEKSTIRWAQWCEQLCDKYSSFEKLILCEFAPVYEKQRCSFVSCRSRFFVLKVRLPSPKSYSVYFCVKKCLLSSKISSTVYFVCRQCDGSTRCVYLLKVLQLCPYIRFVYSQQSMIRFPVYNVNIECKVLC